MKLIGANVTKLSLSGIANLLEFVERSGEGRDHPEGVRYVQLPDALLRALAARIRELEAFWRQPKHERDEQGACVGWCYACERSGAEARIRFTEDYETLKHKLWLCERGEKV